MYDNPDRNIRAKTYSSFAHSKAYVCMYVYRIHEIEDGKQKLSLQSFPRVSTFRCG